MLDDVYLNRLKELIESGNGNELCIVRGQMRNIFACEKDDTKERYYLADLKVPRNTDTGNIFNVSFSNYHVCISSEFVKASGLTDETIKNFKDNEVFVSLSALSNIKTLKAKDGQSEFKVNNVRFLVDDIMLVNKIDKVSNINQKKVAI